MLQSLPPDVLPLIADSCGEHAHGMLERARLAEALNDRQMRIVPVAIDGTCKLNLLDVATLSSELNLMVYDTDARRIVPIASRHLKFTFDEKSHKSARLYLPCNAIVWTPGTFEGNNVWLMHPRGAPLVDVRPMMTREEKKRAALVETQIVQGSRRDKSKERDVESVLHTVGRQLKYIRNLDLTGDCVTPQNQQQFLHATKMIENVNASALERLTLTAVKLCATATQQLVEALPATLMHLEISFCEHLCGKSHATRCAIVAMANLLIRWRETGTDTCKNVPSTVLRERLQVQAECLCRPLRKLVLDEANIAFLAELIHGLAHPLYSNLDFVTDSSMMSDEIFLSVNGCSHNTWMECLAKASCVRLIPDVKFKAPIREMEGTAPKKKARLLAKPQQIVGATVPSHVYANPRRELLRYMWQPTDHTCRNCGFIWRKHSVTISWRETCVSMCLKGKKACKMRDESARVEAGELWITDKNVVGNGGMDATPTPEKTLECEENGQLVGVDPQTGQYVVWNR